MLRDYQPGSSIEDFRNGVERDLFNTEFADIVANMHLNLDNGPVIPDEEWEQACRDRTDAEHINGWNGHQEDGNPQNEAVDDPGQEKAHQANIQTLCRKRKLNFNTNQFSKNPLLVHSK